MVRWKHTGQRAIRRVPRSAIRPGSRADLPVHPVWGFALEKTRLRGGKVPDGPGGIYCWTTGSSHAVKTPSALGGCSFRRRGGIARSIKNLKWQVSRRFTWLPLRAFAYGGICSHKGRDRDCYECGIFVSWARVARSGHAARPSGSSVHRADAR
jgi:hypothetical protein